MKSIQKQNNIVLRYATEQDISKLTAFRISQFKHSEQFILVVPDMLSKIRGKVMIAEFNHTIVSTMQFETCHSAEEFEHISGAVLPTSLLDQQEKYPSYYLSKAATHKSFRKKGLNGLMRLRIIELALKSHNIQSLTGVAFDNAPRLKTLLDLGYDFFEIEISEDDYTQALEKTFFLHLPSQSFKTAAKHLESQLQNLSSSINIELQLAL